MEKIRLLLADDHGVLRAGLKTLFRAQPDVEVVAEASNGDDAVRQSRETNPDIVLMDITMPGLNGLAATQKIKCQNPETKVLILTMHEDESYLYQAFRAGADGYVPKKAADTEVIAAIRATFRGEHYIHPSMTSSLVDSLRQKEILGTTTYQHDGLSEREREVLRLLALGHTNQQIADALYLSVKTVETYKSRLKDKLGCEGRAELVRYAIRMGLIDMQV
jgi:two-component system response regulator NreC